MQEILILILVGIVLYYILGNKQQDAGANGQGQAQGNRNAGSDAGDIEFYEKQNVLFVTEKDSYSKIFKKEINSDTPHFNTLRKYAASGAKGRDYFGVKVGQETWLLPVSQQDLKELYSYTNLGGIMESVAFYQAGGYAPRGVPFIKSTEHWKAVRKSLTPIFHSDWMEVYLSNFTKAMKDLVKTWNDHSGSSRNVKKDISDMAYDAAMYSLIGSKLDIEVGYNGENGEEKLHIRDFNFRNMVDYAKHSASDEFVVDKAYRKASSSQLCENLDKNLTNFEEALTGLVAARAKEITDGAESKKTIVDAAIGLVVQGKLEDVNEGVQNGWAVLNGAHLGSGNALAAALYYLLKNPECLQKLRDEIKNELFEGKDVSVDDIESYISAEKLHELEYLLHVVKETLRLSSPIFGKPMRATEDITLKSGFKLRKDTVVYATNGVVGASENIWENPLDFIPDRFDPESSYFKLPNGSKREPISWLAFGAGPRVCQGQSYAMNFIKVGLVYFLTLFNFNLQDVNHDEGFFYWMNDKNFKAVVAKN